MANSLQDQLLNIGLVNKKKAHASEKEKKKRAKDKRKGENIIDEAKVLADNAKLSKKERDKEYNLQQKSFQEEKAINAQITQLITLNKIAESGELTYHFKSGNKVKKLCVNNEIQDKLSRGVLAIIVYNNSHAIIPVSVAKKIQQRMPKKEITIAESNSDISKEQDMYADYKIPDDLMW
jgi:uncharacterized protein YaiL (DUF2058 family)